MVKIIARVTISQPIERVFSFMADFANMPKIGSGVSKIKHLGGPKIGLGAKYQTFGQIWQKQVEGFIEVIEFAKNQSFKAKGIFGHVAFEDSFKFEKTLTGTRVTQTSLSFPGGLFGFLSFLYKPIVAYFINRDLASLKKVLESRFNQ